MDPRPAPLMVTTRQLSALLGVSYPTIAEWVRKGRFPNAVKPVTTPRIWPPSPPRKPNGAPGYRWLIPLTDVESLLEQLYAGRPVPPSLYRGLRRVATSRVK